MKPNVFDEEDEWVSVHQLVRHLQAAMKMRCGNKSGSRNSPNPVGKHTANGAKIPTRRRRHSRSPAPRHREQAPTKERDRSRERAGEVGMGPRGKLSKSCALIKLAASDRAEMSRQEEPHAIKKTDEQTSREKEAQRDRLVRDYRADRRRIGTGREACGQRNEPERAAPNGTPREGSLEGGGRGGRERYRSHRYSWMPLTEDGGGGSTNTELLAEDQVLLSSVQVATAVCEFGSCSPSRVCLLLPETGGIHADEAQGSCAALPTAPAGDHSPIVPLHRDTNRDLPRGSDGGEDADGEILAKTTRRIEEDRSSGGSRPAGGAMVVARRAYEAVGEIAGKGEVLSRSKTVAAQADPPGKSLPKVQQLQGQRKLGQPPCDENDLREAAHLRQFPKKKSVADQLRELSERLSRICVLPDSQDSSQMHA